MTESKQEPCKTCAPPKGTGNGWIFSDSDDISKVAVTAKRCPECIKTIPSVKKRLDIQRESRHGE